MFSPLSRVVVTAVLGSLASLAIAGCPAGQVTNAGAAAPVEGVTVSGNAVDIESAVRAIAPKGWSVANPDHLSTSVSWVPAKSWSDVLVGMARQAKVCVTVDSAAKRVTVRAAALDDAAPIATMPAVDDELLLAKEEPKPAASKATAPASAVSAPAPPVPAKPVSATPSPPATTAPSSAPSKPAVVAAATPVAVKSTAPVATPSAPVSPAPKPTPPAKPVAVTAPAAPASQTTVPQRQAAPVVRAEPATPVAVGSPTAIKVRPDDVPIAALPNDLLSAVNTAEGAYELRPGETLRQALTRWTKEASWTLVWRADLDYVIDAPVSFPRGTSLQEAVRLTLKAFWSRTQTLTATVYKNQVLLIAGRNTP